MLQAKRWWGLLTALAVLLSAGVVPATAAPEGATEASPFIEVFGAEGWNTGVSLTEASDTMGYGTDNNAAAGTKYHCTVVETGGERGKALQWQAVAAANWPCMTLNLATDATVVTDWTGAKELWCYVDVSAYGEEETGFNFFFNDAASVWYGWKDARVYLYNQTTATWSTATIVDISGGCGYTPLPAGFVGWVRMPLDTATFDNPSWAAQKDAMALSSVSRLNFGFKLGEGQIGDSAYVDSFCILNKTWEATDGLPSDYADHTQPTVEPHYTEVFGAEGWHTGVNLTEANDTLGYGQDDNHAAGTKYHCTVVETGGERGKALQWQALATHGWCCMTLKLATDATAVTDWTGAKELWCYIDVSAYGEEAGGFNFFLRDAAAVWYIWAGNTVYLYEGTSTTPTPVVVENANAEGCGYVPLPAGFAGWVRMPLNTTVFRNPSWSAQREAMDLKTVSRLSFGLTLGEDQIGHSAYIDSFCILNKAWEESDGLPSDYEDRTKEEQFVDDYVGPTGLDYDREGAAAYLYATFRDNSVQGEQLYYSVSTDGLHFTPLNNNEAVFTPTLGNAAIRDPYIFQGQDGHFYMVSSDVRSSVDWTGDNTFVIYRSADLIDWEEWGLFDLNGYDKTNIQAWAPEAIWDEERDMYMLTWMDTVPGSNRAIYYAYSQDLKTLATEPDVLYSVPGVNIFEPDIYYYEGIYYLYYSDQSREYNKQGLAISNHASGPYINKSGALDIADPMPSLEGPNLVKVIGENKWRMMVDCYMHDYVGLLETTDFYTFSTLTPDVDYAFDGARRSGSIFQITQAEYDALVAAFPNDPVPDEPEIGREVYGFEGVPVGTDFVDDETYGYGHENQGQVGTHFTAEVVQTTGGRALKWTTLEAGAGLSARSNARLVLNLSADTTAATDWAGAQELAFYVDASAYGNGTQAPAMGLRLTTTDNSVWMPTRDVYACADGDEAWSRLAVSGNAIKLPVGFKGWVRVPLAPDNWGAAWGNSATGTFPEQPQVSRIWLIAGGLNSNAAFVGTSLWFDSFTLLSDSRRGDINGDGKVSVTDVRQALRAAVGKVTLTQEQQARADVNGDGKVTVSDVRQILRAAVGKITL